MKSLPVLILMMSLLASGFSFGADPKPAPEGIPPVIGMAQVDDPEKAGVLGEWAIQLTLPKVTWKQVGEAVPLKAWPELKAEVEMVTLNLRMGGPSALAPSRLVGLKGEELDRAAILKRLAKATPVLVSISGSIPDAYYLQLAKPDTLIVVLGPRDGSPAPGFLPAPAPAKTGKTGEVDLPGAKPLPEKIVSLRAKLAVCAQEDARKITLDLLGPPARNIGSGLRIEQWDLGGGVLTLHPSAGSTFRGVDGTTTWLIDTRNEIEPYLLASYEMVSLANENGGQFWLGNLELDPAGTYRYKPSGSGPPDGKQFRVEHFFAEHPEGKFKLAYPKGIKVSDTNGAYLSGFPGRKDAGTPGVVLVQV